MRTKIGSIECEYCGKTIDIYTEEIEWEHLSDCGKCDEDETLHDFHVFQKVECSCGRNNKFIFQAKGPTIDALNFDSFKVSSMEVNLKNVFLSKNRAMNH